MATWPASLPQCLSIGTTRKAQEGKLRSQPDTGPAKTRQRFTAVAVDYSGDMLLYGDQLQTFLRFHNDDLGMGALQFGWVDPVDDTLAFVRIKGYDTSVVGGNEDPAKRVWRLSLDIEVMPRAGSAWPANAQETIYLSYETGDYRLRSKDDPYDSISGQPQMLLDSSKFPSAYDTAGGTWIIEGDFDDIVPLEGVGFDTCRISGSGTFVYRYDGSGGAFFANGEKQFDTFKHGDVAAKLNPAGLSRVRYFPFALSDSGAASETSGTLTIDYLFLGGESLVLDFAQGDYGTRNISDAMDVLRTTNASEVLTVERATPKWVFGPNGKLREVPPNTLARQWNPETGEPEGALIEESRTNLLTWSEDATQAPWTTASDLRAEPYSDPRGLTHTMLYTEGTDNFSSLRQYAVIPDNDGLTYTFSLVLKLFGHPDARNMMLGDSRHTSSSRRWYVEIDSASGAIVEETNTTNTKHVDLGGGYHRYTLTFINDGTKSTDINMTFRSNSVDRVDIAAIGTVQFEQGSTPSSYIPTEDAPVTRAADNVSRVLGEEFNQEQGTIITELELRKQSAGNPNPWCASIDTQIRAEFIGDSLRLALDLRGAGQGFNTTSLYGVEGRNKLAVGYRDGEVVAALNGSTQTLTVEGSMGTLLEGLNLGRRTSSSYLNSSMGEFTYIPRALSESELIELTS